MGQKQESAWKRSLVPFRPTKALSHKPQTGQKTRKHFGNVWRLRFSPPFCSSFPFKCTIALVDLVEKGKEQSDRKRFFCAKTKKLRCKSLRKSLRLVQTSVVSAWSSPSCFVLRQCPTLVWIFLVRTRSVQKGKQKL